jgi:hypothetical protein
MEETTEIVDTEREMKTIYTGDKVIIEYEGVGEQKEQEK